MNTKLDNITTQYRKFNENQALTEGQLNEFIDYFEDQDRLSRTQLSGVGLVCGFESTLTGTSLPQKMATGQAAAIEIQDFNSITITQGAGVTTDGDLITLREKNYKSKEVSIDFESKRYTHYRNYVDNLKYPHFFKNGQQMPLVELFTTEEVEILVADGADSKAFHKVTEISPLNKIIILYLESYSNEESPCEDADCDNQGAEQVSNLKVLLADVKDVDAYMVNGDAKDSIYRLHDGYEKLYDALTDIEARRVILHPGITTAVQLKTEFQDAIYNADTVSDLIDGFKAIAKTFNVSLNFGGQTLESKLNALLSTTAPNLDDYQYRYDLLKDLIDTYNEIKGLVLHLKSECCPSIASFPKHLMLGPVAAPLNLGDYTRFRHDFYNSPINTNDDENYEKLISLANRFVKKINSFQSFQGQIKITPSRKQRRLGDLAIPYHYKVTQDLLESWNFEKTQTDKETYNLSYHTANLASDDFVQNPLFYNIDDNDFFRIEGHLGMPYKIALKNIKDLIIKYSLPINVAAIVLNEEKPTSAAKQIATIPTAVTSELTTISIKQLRDQLFSISSDISNEAGDPQRTLQTISSLDSQLRKLNDVEYEPGSVSVIRQDPKEDDVVSELLSEFLELKSGLEHVAGAGPGETFFLIYESDTKNKVLADFTLPYLCCSKKDPVFLVLPAAKLCQNDAPVPVTIIPLDGEIKTYVNGTQINVITQSGGQNFFNPNLVNSQYFGDTITFTVNDDAVDTQMVVHAQPNVNVTTGAVVYGENPNAPEATVTFNISGHQTGFTYTWDFDDNSTENPQPVNGVVSHKYFLDAVGQEDIYRPTLTVTNPNGCSTKYNITPITLKLVINKNTKIHIYFDSSGSMDSTLFPLQSMRDNLLKNRLLPLYGNDTVAYNNNVKVISNGAEQTFNFLNLQGQPAPEGNIIVLVFQDEAHPIYHENNSIASRTSTFSTDIQALKTRIANNFGTNNPNYYRGVVFQVDGNAMFQQLMMAVETGSNASYPAQYNLQSEVSAGKVKFKYNVPDGDTPINYLNRVVEALEELGYNIP